MALPEKEGAPHRDTRSTWGIKDAIGGGVIVFSGPAGSWWSTIKSFFANAEDDKTFADLVKVRDEALFAGIAAATVALGVVYTLIGSNRSHPKYAKLSDELNEQAQTQQQR